MYSTLFISSCFYICHDTIIP